jgi:crotonobetaine/carnitine-CoA ligase
MTMAERMLRDPSLCVLRPLIDRRAAETPEKMFVLFEDGSSLTYAELRREVRRIAGNLQRLGVEQGDFVLSWLGNGAPALCLWFALNYIGAVYVPVNTSYRGRLLEHVIANSGARLMVADARLAARLAEVERAGLATLVTIGGAPLAIPGLRTLAEGALTEGDPELMPLAREIMPWDTQSVIYTSGTTGPSKGVLSSYLHLATSATAFPAIGPEDRNLINLPLFHVGGTSGTYRMLLHGGSIALVEAFNTQTFWATVRRTGTTAMTLLGAMIAFLLKEPPSAADRDHPLRRVIMVPLSDDSAAFAERFGVDVYTTFNMTEISCPIFSERNPAQLKTCGRLRAGFAARVVDENDRELPDGTVGELVVRSATPWTMNHGYHGNAEATARAWRNGWFHTGDAFRRDADGNFYFVDRIKDAIRRRGENISSFEVEAELAAHPAVREAAVVGVASEFGEDEVLAVVSPVPGMQVDPRELIEFVTPRLAHFMVPRFVRVLPELPKTPTQKVQKHLLRAEGAGADTWDREAAGVRLKREKLGGSRFAADRVPT